MVLAGCVSSDSSRCMCVLGKPSSLLSEISESRVVAGSIGMSSEAVDSNWGDLSGQREIFTYSNCHIYHETSFPDGSCDGAAQTGRDAHPYDLTCSLALLNAYRGGRQQLMLVPCAAAEAAADSGAAWIAEACIKKTSRSGSCDGAARAECDALECSLLWSLVSVTPVPDRRLLHL
jgi:hypothetical protein